MKLELLLLTVLIVAGCTQASKQDNSGDLSVPSGSVGLGVNADLPDLSSDAALNVSSGTPDISSESLGDAI